MIIKTDPQTSMPDVEKIKDELVKNFGRDLSEMLMNTLRNTYDDIKALQNVERATSFPTANLESRGHLILVEGTSSAADDLYLCVDTGGGGFAWKNIALT